MANITRFFIICVVCLSVSWTIGSNLPESCPSRCQCNETDGSALCVNTGLHSIPEFPSYVISLWFDGNFLENVTSTTFTTLEKLHLCNLSLVNDRIKVISDNAFGNLHFLHSLNLSRNKQLTEHNIVNAINSIRSAYFTSFAIKSLYWTNEPTDLWKALSRFNITQLAVCESSFNTLNLQNISVYMPHLIHLQIIFGAIQQITPGYLPSLKILELQYNYIEIDIGFFGNESCYFPVLEELRLDSNFINYFQHRFYCLDKLKTLTLNKNPVKQILNDTFANLTSLETLSLSDLGNRLFKIESYAFRSETLKNLIFSNNGLKFDDYVYNFEFDKENIFSHIPKLQSLDLSGNYFNLSSDVFGLMVSKATSLLNLTLQSCFLETLPSNIHYNMKNLQVLDLTDNKISSWNGNTVFGNGTALQKIFLRKNSINIINDTSFPVQSLLNLSIIDLSHNLFACTCDNLWLKQWIETNKAMFEDYPDNYLCKSPESKYNTKLQDYNPTIVECNNMDNQIFLIIVGSFTLIGTTFVVIASILYKARWHIRYWIYLSAIKRKGFIRLTDEIVEYEFDGFVIYSDSDRKWVKEQLVFHIETEANIKLCVHHRDFHAGKLIVDNIAQNMSVSRKILIILSRDMVQSDWCLFETRVAQEKFLNKEMDALVLIMLENISKEDMPTSIRSLVNSTTYIQWPRKEYEEPKFWTEIEEVLRR